MPAILIVKPFEGKFAGQEAGRQLDARPHPFTPHGLLPRIASDAVLGQAHAWICRQRREYTPRAMSGTCVGAGTRSGPGCNAQSSLALSASGRFAIDACVGS